MRNAVIILVVIVLSCLFIAQRRHEHKAATEQAAAQQTASPRPVSEHNWAKHSLDTTRKVMSQVAEQRKTDGTTGR